MDAVGLERAVHAVEPGLAVGVVLVEDGDLGQAEREQLLDDQRGLVEVRRAHVERVAVERVAQRLPRRTGPPKEVDGLPATFPRLKSLGSPSTLPTPATSLVGRSAERQTSAQVIGARAGGAQTELAWLRLPAAGQLGLQFAGRSLHRLDGVGERRHEAVDEAAHRAPLVRRGALAVRAGDVAEQGGVRERHRQGVADEHPAEHVLRPVGVEEVEEVPGPHFVDGSEQQISLAGHERIRAIARAKSLSESTAPSSCRKLKRAPRTPASFSLAR